MKIFFDFDGVMRHLGYPIFKRHPKYWNEQPPHWQEGYGYFDLVKWYTEKPELLYFAPPTEYCQTVLTTCRQLEIMPEFVSCQPISWRDITSKWITYYMWRYDFHRSWGIHWVREPEEKFNYIGKGNLIVEDYPLFKNNKQVILIDRPYNKYVIKPFARVKTPKQLKNLLQKLCKKESDKIG